MSAVTIWSCSYGPQSGNSERSFAAALLARHCPSARIT